MECSNNARRRSSVRSGFTLIELLVVVSIILVVSSIIIVGGKGGSGAQLSSAQRILSGIAQGARGQAILKGTTTRIIIYSDAASNEADEKKLRFCGIVYGDPDTLDASGNPTQWIAATKGDLLPEGIYFNPDQTGKKGINIPSMKLNYPRASAVAAGMGDSFYYYEFNRNGTMSTSPMNFNNSWLVIQAGDLVPASAGKLKVDFDDPANEYLTAGLIFRRVGTTTLVSDPDDIIR